MSERFPNDRPLSDAERQELGKLQPSTHKDPSVWARAWFRCKTVDPLVDLTPRYLPLPDVASAQEPLPYSLAWEVLAAMPPMQKIEVARATIAAIWDGVQIPKAPPPEPIETWSERGG